MLNLFNQYLLTLPLLDPLLLISYIIWKVKMNLFQSIITESTKTNWWWNWAIFPLSMVLPIDSTRWSHKSRSHRCGLRNTLWVAIIPSLRLVVKKIVRFQVIYNTMQHMLHFLLLNRQRWFLHITVTVWLKLR